MGEAITLAAGVAAVVAVLVVIASTGGRSQPVAAPSPASPAHRTAPPRTSTPVHRFRTPVGGTLTVRGTGIAHIHLTSPDHARLPTGTAEVSRDGTRYAVMVIVGGLRPPPPESAYALWLAGGPAKSHLLGIVTPGVGVKGHVLRVAGPVPADVLSYRRLVITLGHKAHPRLLGRVVLQGPLTGGK